MLADDDTVFRLLPAGDGPWEFTEATLPRSYRRRHRTPPQLYVKVSVFGGRLRLMTWTDKDEHTEVLVAGQTKLLPPLTEHSFQPDGPVRFSTRWFTEDDPNFHIWCPTCHGKITRSDEHPTCQPHWPGRKQERFYGRPRAGENDDQFTARVSEGVMSVVHRQRVADTHEQEVAEAEAELPPPFEGLESGE